LLSNLKTVIRPFILIIGLVLLVSLFKFRSPEPNIILISIDTLRQDHVGIYGYKRNTTPTIDKIAKEGIFFENAFSSASWTLPAHMSMFTGLPPSVHSVEKKTNKLSKNIQTLTQLIKSKGYKTAAIVTLPFVSAKYGFARGFDKFTEIFKKKSRIVSDNALSWLKTNKDKQFFLFLHFCDVHWPYLPPAKFAEEFGIDTKNSKWREWGRLVSLRKFSDPEIPMSKKMRKNVIGLYDGEILNVDDKISRIINYLKKENIYENTILIITSDHGEEFKEHNSFGHGHSLYSEVINVPLIIRFPKKIKSNIKTKDPVIISDIPLTLLNMLDISPPPQFEKYSVNLEKYFNGSQDKKTGERKLFVESILGSGPKRFAIIKRNHKYFASYKFHPLKKNHKWIQIPESLFDIMNDPKDLINISPDKTSDKKISFLQKNLKSHLNRYIMKNVKGVQLVFSPSRDSTGESINYRGYVQFDHDLEGRPFGVNFSGLDFLDAEEGRPFGVNFSGLDFLDAEEINGRFKFSIDVKSSSKRIYMPIFDRKKK